MSLEIEKLAKGDEPGVDKINKNFDEVQKQFASNDGVLNSLRNAKPARNEIQTVTVTDGGTFTPPSNGFLVVNVQHTEQGTWAVCVVKTADKYKGSQQNLYVRHGYGRMYDVTTIPVYAGEALQFQTNNTAVMTMTADFIPLK